MDDQKITILPRDTDVDPSRRRGLSPDKILFYIVAVLVVVGIGGYFGGRKVWQELRIRRAREQASKAEDFVRQENFLEAQRAVRTAVKLAPNDPAVLRITANWCTLTGSPDGFVYWDRLAQFTPPTRGDRLKKLDLALALQRLDISRDLLKVLLTETPNDREVLARAVMHHTLTGLTENAVQAARIAVATLPSDPQLQFLLGKLLLETSDRSSQSEARRLLWNVALDNSTWRDSAVDLLVRNRDLNDGDRLLLIHSIEARTPVSLEDRLRVLDLRLPMVSDRDRVWSQTDDLRAQYPGSTNQTRLAIWLAIGGATNRCLAMLPWDAVGTNQYAAQGTLEALARCQDWNGMRTLIERKPVALPASAQESARGVLATTTGAAADANGYFANAIQKAAANPMELIQVSAYAELARQPVLAASALIRAVEVNPLLTVQLCRHALALVQPIEDLTVARRTMEKLVDYLPGEPSVLLERSWLDLLFNEQVDRARTALSHIIDHPAVGREARVMLALADLRRNDPAGALSRLEALGVEPATLTPRSQAVYSAVLLANNQREPARRLVVGIPTNKLRKKELELIAPLR